MDNFHLTSNIDAMTTVGVPVPLPSYFSMAFGNALQHRSLPGCRNDVATSSPVGNSAEGLKQVRNRTCFILAETGKAD